MVGGLHGFYPHMDHWPWTVDHPRWSLWLGPLGPSRRGVTCGNFELSEVFGHIKCELTHFLNHFFFSMYRRFEKTTSVILMILKLWRFDEIPIDLFIQDMTAFFGCLEVISLVAFVGYSVTYSLGTPREFLPVGNLG